VGLDVQIDRTISANESLHHGGLEIRLIPVTGGETEDALFVHLPKQGLLFVGDAFMPYVGPPFLSEGSPQGYLEALATVRTIAPLTRADWATLVDQGGDGTEAPFVRVAEELVGRGDAPIALALVEMGLLRHPGSESLKRMRTKALSMLIERYNPVDPFRFIIY